MNTIKNTKSALCIGMILAASTLQSAQPQKDKEPGKWERFQTYLAQGKNRLTEEMSRERLSKRGRYLQRTTKEHLPAIITAGLAAGAIIGGALWLRSRTNNFVDEIWALPEMPGSLRPLPSQNPLNIGTLARGETHGRRMVLNAPSRQAPKIPAIARDAVKENDDLKAYINLIKYAGEQLVAWGEQAVMLMGKNKKYQQISPDLQSSINLWKASVMDNKSNFSALTPNLVRTLSELD